MIAILSFGLVRDTASGVFGVRAGHERALLSVHRLTVFDNPGSRPSTIRRSNHLPARLLRALTTHALPSLIPPHLRPIPLHRHPLLLNPNIAHPHPRRSFPRILAPCKPLQRLLVSRNPLRFLDCVLLRRRGFPGQTFSSLRVSLRGLSSLAPAALALRVAARQADGGDGVARGGAVEEVLAALGVDAYDAVAKGECQWGWFRLWRGGEG